MESDSGNHSRFDAPSGKSVSGNEAKERRDNEPSQFGGHGVTGNVDIVEGIIAPKFIGYPLGHQADFDALVLALDGTEDRSNLGTNTLTALSGAYFLLSCYEQKKEIWEIIADTLGTTPAMPRLYANLVGGGAHAPGLDIQEFMVVPKTTQVTDSINLIYILRKTLRSIFANLYGPAVKLVSDEGAMAPLGATPEVVLEAFQQLAHSNNDNFDIALDCAANFYFKDGGYNFSNRQMTMQELGAMYMQWDKQFPLLSLEDPFAEQDLEGLKYLSTQPGRKAIIVGDDTTATNATRIQDLAAQKLIGAVIIKPNQVGTISDMFSAISAAMQSDVKLIISHRSGESNDTFLADLAYGTGAFGMKLGSPVRGERIAKYNRLFEIEKDQQLKTQAPAPAQTPVINPLPMAPQTPAALPTDPAQPQSPAQPASGPIHLAPAPGPLSGIINQAPAAPAASPTPGPFPATDLHQTVGQETARALHRYNPNTETIASEVTDPMGQAGHSPHAQAYAPASSGPAAPPVGNPAVPPKFPR